MTTRATAPTEFSIDPTPYRRYEHFDRLPQLEVMDAAARAAGQPPRLRRSGKAAIGTMHVVRVAGKPRHFTVRARCGSRDARPCCVTHGETFDTVDALAAHCTDERDHVTAWVCGEIEPPAHQSALGAFGGGSSAETVHGLESEEPWDNGAWIPLR